MTSMYATPGQQSMYMPSSSVMIPQQPGMVETVAFPGGVETVPLSMQMVPQMQMVAQPSYSYVPPPQQVEYAQPSMLMSQTPAAPAPAFAGQGPQRLTDGLPEPAKVEAEKVAYERALDAQLKKQSDAVLAEGKLKKAMMEQTAKMQLGQFQLQIEEQLKMASMQVDAEADTMIRGLEESAIMQKTNMQERAAMTIADYVKKKAIEDCNKKSYDVQRQFYEAEVKLTAQYQQARQAGAKSVVTPAGPQIPVGVGI